MTSRREFFNLAIKGSALTAAAALIPRDVLALATGDAQQAPQAGKRAQPSFYRLKLGTIEITVVSDGTLEFPAETLFGERAEDARGLLSSTRIARFCKAILSHK